MKKYLDMNGVEIKEGSIIDCGDNIIEKVYATSDEGLGICASNPEYLKYHPEADIEYYPLQGNFSCTVDNDVIKMKEIKVVCQNE